MKAFTIMQVIFLFVVWSSCTRSSGNPITRNNQQTNAVFISKAQAKRMIKSYEKSINYPSQDLHLRAIAYNADSLRLYLQDTNIKRVRFILAHDMDYILAGGEGKVPPPGVAGVTAVILGVDKENKYVFHLIDKALDNGMPCPDNCNLLGHPSQSLE